MLDKFSGKLLGKGYPTLFKFAMQIVYSTIIMAIGAAIATVIAWHVQLLCNRL